MLKQVDLILTDRLAHPQRRRRRLASRHDRLAPTSHPRSLLALLGILSFVGGPFVKTKTRSGPSLFRSELTRSTEGLFLPAQALGGSEPGGTCRLSP